MANGSLITDKFPGENAAAFVVRVTLICFDGVSHNAIDYRLVLEVMDSYHEDGIFVENHFRFFRLFLVNWKTV